MCVCVCVRERETHQLKMCDVFFPSEVFLYTGSKAAQSVVCVHDNMNECVYERTHHRCIES